MEVLEEILKLEVIFNTITTSETEMKETLDSEVGIDFLNVENELKDIRVS